MAVSEADDAPVVGPVGLDGAAPGRVESVGTVRHFAEGPVVAHNIRLAVNNVGLRGHSFTLNIDTVRAMGCSENGKLFAGVTSEVRGV